MPWIITHRNGRYVSQGIRSLIDFKRNTPEFVKRLKESGLPEVLTIEGRRELVVQDAAAYQKLLELVDRAEAVAGIRRGIADLEAGRHVSLDEFEAAMRAKHNIPKEHLRVDSGPEARAAQRAPLQLCCGTH